MKTLFFILLLTACSSRTPVPELSTGHEVKPFTHFRAIDAGDVLRNTNAATIGVWVKGATPTIPTAGLFNISVGGNHEQWKSRAGIHVFSNGSFQAVARAADSDEVSQVFTKTGLMKEDQWQHVAAMIDYENQKIEIFLDGKKMEAGESTIRFSRKTTSDTPSHHVTLGAEDDGRGSYFEGQLAGAVIERRILTPEELAELIKKTRP